MHMHVDMHMHLRMHLRMNADVHEHEHVHVFTFTVAAVWCPRECMATRTWAVAQGGRGPVSYTHLTLPTKA